MDCIHGIDIGDHGRGDLLHSLLTQSGDFRCIKVHRGLVGICNFTGIEIYRHGWEPVRVFEGKGIDGFLGYQKGSAAYQEEQHGRNMVSFYHGVGFMGYAISCLPQNVYRNFSTFLVLT